MKDIPMFVTENGVASLSFQQIPYTGFAHITIHSSQAFEAFVGECVGFCRAVGAERILACGHDSLNAFPIYTKILRMQMDLQEERGSDCLFPVTEKTLDRWIEIYNTGMKNVPNATILSKRMGLEYVEKGAAYFVHNDGGLLGIGIIEDDVVQAIVSCKKGAGERVMKCLFNAISGDVVKVDVAENNLPAMNLYGRMGFIPISVVKIWHDVTKNIFDVK